MAWTHEELLAAAQTVLLGPGAVTDGYEGKSATIQSDDLVVRFGWRRHPRQFQVRVPITEPDRGPWTGIPTHSAEEWVHEVSGLLMEELDTGATHWAVRRDQDGAVELDLEADPPSRSAYYVSDARSLGAWWLAEQGLDVEQAVAAEAAGTLHVWMQMYVDNARGEPVVAQILILKDDDADSALVTQLQNTADVPVSDLTRLVHHALCAAAERGASRITSTFHHPALVGAGMKPHGTGLLLDPLKPWPVPDALRQPR